jgi:hypothetical protein
VIGLFVTIVGGNLFRQLDASVEASGPHDFAVRVRRIRLAHQKRPSHPAPNVRDDREAPLFCGARDGRISASDLHDEASKAPATRWHDGQISCDID